MYGRSHIYFSLDFYSIAEQNNKVSFHILLSLMLYFGGANRFHTFYFRQRTPLDILKAIPSAKKEVKISLRTKCRATAITQARQHKVMFDLLFLKIRLLFIYFIIFRLKLLL